jgi:hypothetical protein
MMEAEERTGYRSGDPKLTSHPSQGPIAFASDAAAEPAPLCDRCGAPMLDRHCRLICMACGFQRDCSDP